MEVWDMEPQDWPEAATRPFADVLGDSAAWAKKCVEHYGADMIAVQLKSTDPNGLNKGPEEAAAVVRKVLEAVDVPVIVWGCNNVEKDREVLRKIAEDCQGRHVALGPVEEATHKQIGAAALGYKHTVISSSPIDVNLAKQVNILLENLGVKDDVIIDPTTGGLGYGLEYSYSVMERIRMAALVQEDDKLQFPIICNLGHEIWKSKEAKLTRAETSTMGDPLKRGYLMESVAAVAYLLAGADILVLRHPETVKLVKSFIGLMINGGQAFSDDSLAARMAEIKKKPEALGIPVQFTRKAEEAVAKAEPAKKAAPPKEKAEPVKVVEFKKPAVKEEPAKAAAAKATAEQAAVAGKAVAEKAAEEAKAAQAAKEAADKAAAEKAAMAAAKAAAEKAAAEKLAKEQADKEAAKAAARQQEEARRAARVAEKEQRGAAPHRGGVEASITPATVQMSRTEKFIQRLDRVHRRNI
jgi:acetyl-CoA decarbonylase/synthase complex subunit delta